MGESNETIVSLQHVKDIYSIESGLCDELIRTYDIAGRQLFRLAEAWDSFKSRRRKTMPNNQ
jgi:hypothetical protein